MKENNIVIKNVTYMEPQKVMLGEMTIDEYINRKVEEQVQLRFLDLHEEVMELIQGSVDYNKKTFDKFVRDTRKKLKMY